MSRTELRPIVKLRSTAGTGTTYVTRKNRTGLTPQQQRRVATAIRDAREMALLPYPNAGRG